MTELQAMIGLEVHVQLNTQSKLFCSCANKENEEPNSNTCQICLGHPGSKPLVNKQAIEKSIKLGIGLNCKINTSSFFSRKTYFYPDMSKNFQITQYEIPLCENGFITLDNGKKIRIRRVHLEEDPAKLMHKGTITESTGTLIDYNRSGCPLVEIVSEPDIENPEQAREFLDKLTSILDYLEVFDEVNGTLKADSNISIKGNERVEVKNVTGKKNVELALNYEFERQKKLVEQGEKIKLETRAFDEEKIITRSLRSKESEEDYGYIFEPDLPEIEIDAKWLNEIKKSIPELPEQKIKRFEKEFGIDKTSASVLAIDRFLAELFEKTAKVNPKMVASFMQIEFLSVIKHDNHSLKELNLKSDDLLELMKLLNENKITKQTAKQSVIEWINKKVKPIDFIKKNNLMKVSDVKDLEKIVDSVLKENKKAIDEFKAGNEKSLNYLQGQVMKASQGKADQKIARDLILQKLK